MITLLLASWLSLSGGADGECPPFVFARPLMGVEVRMVLHARTRREGEIAARAAFAEVRRLNRIFSDYEPTSEVGLLAAAAGTFAWRPTSPEFRDLARQGEQLQRESDGAFDITVGPLTRLWRGARREGPRPDPCLLEQAKRVAAPRELEWSPDRSQARLRSAGASLDFGGIAKGFAIDRALAVLTAHGIASALVQADGDIAVSAPPPARPGWLIEIADLPESAEAPDLLLAEPSAVSTSGDAHQHFAVAGQRLSHLIDPRSQEPVVGQRYAVVIARSGSVADSVATTLCIVAPNFDVARLGLGASLLGVRRGDAHSIHESSPGFEIRRQAAGFAPR